MRVAVVDRLEVIDIEDRQRDHAALLDVQVELLLDPRIAMATVGEPRQRIVLGFVIERAIELGELGVLVGERRRRLLRFARQALQRVVFFTPGANLDAQFFLARHHLEPDLVMLLHCGVRALERILPLVQLCQLEMRFENRRLVLGRFVVRQRARQRVLRSGIVAGMRFDGANVQQHVDLEPPPAAVARHRRDVCETGARYYVIAEALVDDPDVLDHRQHQRIGVDAAAIAEHRLAVGKDRAQLVAHNFVVGSSQLRFGSRRAHGVQVHPCAQLAHVVRAAFGKRERLAHVDERFGCALAVDQRDAQVAVALGLEFRRALRRQRERGFVRSDRFGPHSELAVSHAQRRQDQQFLLRIADVAIQALGLEQRAHDAGVFGQLDLRPRPRTQCLDAHRRIALGDIDCTLRDLVGDAHATDTCKLPYKFAQFGDFAERTRTREPRVKFGI